MEKVALDKTNLDEAVAAAVAEILHVRSWGTARFISLPFFYPSGSNAVVKVESSFGGFVVTDSGLAFRELDNVGGDRFYSANARKAATAIGARNDGRAVTIEVGAEELGSAIADVGFASTRIVWKAMKAIDRLSQEDLITHLYARLDRIFGQTKVERGVSIFGPSTHEWEVDALVHVDGKDAVFEMVTNHHNSVYPACAMFHDLALIENSPSLTAVVNKKGEFGYLLNILAQAANVVDGEQSDGVFEEAAKWLI